MTLPRSTLLLATLLLALSLHVVAGSEGLEGHWKGAIELPGAALEIRVVFSGGSAGLSATIDIPQQGASGLPLQEVRREGASVHFELAAGPGLATFEGKLQGNDIEGTFMQAGVSASFHLRRAAAENPVAGKPEAPLPYREEEVTFSNGPVRLAGTLTTPEGTGPHPAVILISGSGKQDRDETLLGFKPFAILADALTRRGVAVLRYDDRGVGGSSGDTLASTTAEFAGDVQAAMSLLRARSSIDGERIGLCGHSEGAIVASMVASSSPDEVAFVVLLAGPAVKGDRLLRAQAESLARTSGADEAQVAAALESQNRLFTVVRANEGWEQLERDLREEALAQLTELPDRQRQAIQDLDAFVEATVTAELEMARTRWYRFYLDHDPSVALELVQSPVLAVFGELDLQVPAAINTAALESAMRKAGNDDFTVSTIDGANHLFQKARTGAPSEYGVLEKQFIDGFMDLITGWVERQVSTKGKRGSG